MKAVIRSSQLPDFPTITVTRVCADGMGVDVAWFYEVKDAMEYRDFLNKKSLDGNSQAPSGTVPVPNAPA